MSDDKTPGSENGEDEQEKDKAEDGDKKTHQGPTDSAAPADDDIIIK